MLIGSLKKYSSLSFYPSAFFPHFCFVKTKLLSSPFSPPPSCITIAFDLCSSISIRPIISLTTFVSSSSSSSCVSAISCSPSLPCSTFSSRSFRFFHFSTMATTDLPSFVNGFEKKSDALSFSPTQSFGLRGERTRLSSLLEVADGGASHVGELVTVCGWSRTVRKGGGQFLFIALNDGSTVKNLQVVVDASLDNYEHILKSGVGCSFRCTGEVVASPATGQCVELACRDISKNHKVVIYGLADQSKYPLAKKHHSREFLREIGHLRPRTFLIGAVARLRSHMAQATHQFFHQRGFVYVHTPIITGADCEGAGEMFQVTTILPEAKQKLLTFSSSSSSSEASEDVKREEEEGEKKEVKQNKMMPKPTVAMPLQGDGTLNYGKEFFGKPTYLTVSGQLAVENYCCALSDVYTFGPTFRAENSHTARHLAEFWMIEPEMAFADLEDNMNCGEAFLKFCVKWALEHCRSDLEWFEKNFESGLVKRLEDIVNNIFGRMTYTEAIETLKPHDDEFQVKVTWGMDLGTEHERYLSEKIFKKPVVVYNYPKDIKAFYMRLNDDGKTVAAMDMLVPKIGEVLGGSQREERLDVLDAMMAEKKLDPKMYWWYRELRQYGTIPHSGFGLGFERLLLMISGLDNIRDVIPFPRYPGHADF